MPFPVADPLVLLHLPGFDLHGDTEEAGNGTPFGDPSDVVVTGRLGATRFYFLPRHGRGHRIPPNRVNYRANIYALKLLGAQQVVSVSAVVPGVKVSVAASYRNTA